jgi:hypothetical protein
VAGTVQGNGRREEWKRETRENGMMDGRRRSRSSRRRRFGWLASRVETEADLD